MESPTPMEEPPAHQRETRRLLAAWVVSFVLLVGGTWTWTVLSGVPRADLAWGAIPSLVAPLPGKYAIFATLVPGSPLGPWHVAVLATLSDLAVALTLAVGLGWIARFGWVERSLKRLHDLAQGVLQQFPRLKRMAFLGVVLFVFLPLPASGAVGGTFMAQFVGLSRTAGVVAVTVGGILVSVAFASLATVVGARGREMMSSPVVLVASIAVFALFVAWAWIRVRRQLRQE